MIKKHYYSWQDVERMCVSIVNQMYTDNWRPDYIDDTPVYEEMPGWRTSTVGMTQYSDLPIQAQQYIDRIEELVKTPIELISTGPERDQTIVLNNSLF